MARFLYTCVARISCSSKISCSATPRRCSLSAAADRSTLVLELLLLEQPAQQNHLAFGLEGPELRRALERPAAEDLPAAVMERWPA